ncbi:MAG TPA: hypothetical protein VEJ63_24255 [Planctomycetota bacterium]|nr:hypothetical protein [Planctomycetota bacterium]
MRTLLALLLLVAAMTCFAATDGEIVLPCIADTSIHSFPGDGNEANEWTVCSGRYKRIKIKHREDQLLLRFDLTALPLKKVAAAKLRLFLEGGDGYALNHVCVSTVPTEWDETKANFLQPADGREWGPGRLRFPGVVFGNFGTVTSLTRAKNAGGGWWEIDVAPRVVHALRDSFGLAVMDESGLFAGKFVNIYVSSREGANPPQLLVRVEGEDKLPPAAPKVSVEPGPDAGSLFLDVVCSGNDRETGTALGFEARFLKGATVTPETWDRATALPRVLTPRPGAAGTRIRTFIEQLEPGTEYGFALIAYDECGNRSPVASSALVKARPDTIDRLELQQPKIRIGGPLRAGDLSVWAADALLQISPVRKKVLARDIGANELREGSEIWDGAARCANLRGCKGEQLDFQIFLETSDNPVKDIRLAAGDLRSGEQRILAANFSIARAWYLKSGDEWYINALPPLKADEGLALPAADNGIDGQRLQSLYVNLFIPFDAAPGDYAGQIKIESSSGEITMPLNLTVLDITLPRRLNFEIELNQYVDRQPLEKFHELHRLAHLHRVGYNVLPYSHNGTPTVAYVPPVEGFGGDAAVKDWSKFDAYMGPLLDGSAFKDLPRAGEPLRWSYLPFYENYPMPLYKGYRPAELINPRPAPNAHGYNEWLDKLSREEPLIESAFIPEWFDGNRAVTAQYMQHFAEKNFNRTKFHVMCNNVPFKGTLTAWTLDEPAWGRDFRALALFYKTFVAAAREWNRIDGKQKIEVVGRNGVSRPEWQGDRLDAVSEFSDIAGGPMRDYYPLIRRRMLERGDTYWTYGGGLSVTKDVAMLQAGVLDAWCLGQIGVLPAWTAFEDGAAGWDADKGLALALPGAHGYDTWTPTLKLKALRRAQQDCELYLLLAAEKGWDRWRVARALNAALPLKASTTDRPPEDVQQTEYENMRQEDFSRIRAAVIREILKARSKL